MSDKSTDKITQLLSELLFQQREAGFVHYSLDEEMRPLVLIGQGNLEGAEEAQKHYMGEHTGKTSSDPIRAKKYDFVSTITILCRICIGNGMESGVSYGLSDVYIRQADRCTSLEELYALHAEMLKDYALRMQKITGKKTYSAHVVRCMDYVSHHLQESMHIQNIAQSLGISVSHLSHTFSQETGVELSAYIRDKRLEAAKTLLQHSNLSCTEIAEYFGFSSSAHFSRKFKEHTGMTPLEYRKKHVFQLPIPGSAEK